MLQEFLIPQLDEDVQEGCIHFQQDGAPPHYLGEVREYLNTRFPGRWIGRAAPIAWIKENLNRILEENPGTHQQRLPYLTAG